MKHTDNFYMKKALALAQKADVCKTLPNPRVGALVVKNGRILASGFHKEHGTMHAEIDALSKLNIQQTKNATLYCTLEPCSTTWKGKTQPPCVEALVKHKIKKVFLASKDPNPYMQGKGIDFLRSKGILVEVLTDHTEKENTINEAFFALLKHASLKNGKFVFQRPFVHLKTAHSLDARLADEHGNSNWITSEASRKVVHKMRTQHHALCAGVGTILSDNPLYSVRHVRGRSPALVILDSSLRIPLNAKCLDVENRRDPNTIIYTTLAGYAKKRKIHQLKKKNISVICAPCESKQGEKKVSLPFVLKHLISLNIYSLMVETGATLSNKFLSLGLVDKISCFIAPLFLGGDVKKDYYALGKTLRGREINNAYRLFSASSKNIAGSADCIISGYMYDIFKQSIM